MSEPLASRFGHHMRPQLFGCDQGTSLPRFAMQDLVQIAAYLWPLFLCTLCMLPWQSLQSALAPSVEQVGQSSLPFHWEASVIPIGMDPGARHFLWGVLQRQVIAAGVSVCSPPQPFLCWL